MKELKMSDYYEVLGCSRESTFEELKAAYHDLAKKCHPDKKSDEDEADFRLIDEAWKILRDPESRKAYDRQLLQSEMDQQTLIYGSFKLSDLSFDENTQFYSCTCRCGGTYKFDSKESEQFNSCLVSCDECSLMISVDLL